MAYQGFADGIEADARFYFVHSYYLDPADPALVAENTVTLPVQVNGKRRGEITVKKGLPEEEVRALATENRFPRLAECPQCGAEELRYTAMLPAVVTYERKRAAAPRAQSDPYEPGFHGYKVSCEDCGDVAEQSASCPLCAAPGPLRARPG